MNIVINLVPQMKMIISLISKDYLPIRTSTADKTTLITYRVYLEEKLPCTIVSKLLEIHGKILTHSPLGSKVINLPLSIS